MWWLYKDFYSFLAYFFSLVFFTFGSLVFKFSSDLLFAFFLLSLAFSLLTTYK